MLGSGPHPRGKDCPLQTVPLFSRRRARNVIVRLGAVVLLATAALVATAQPSMAASCSGSSCAGKNPQTQGCSGDGATKKEYSSDIVTVQIRYSPSCDAFWTRVQAGTGPDPFCNVWAIIVQERYLYSRPDGEYFWQRTSQQRLATPHYASCHTGQLNWTYMIADSTVDRYKACWTFAPIGAPPSNSDYDICTGYF